MELKRMSEDGCLISFFPYYQNVKILPLQPYTSFKNASTLLLDSKLHQSQHPFTGFSVKSRLELKNCLKPPPH